MKNIKNIDFSHGNRIARRSGSYNEERKWPGTTKKDISTEKKNQVPVMS